MQCLQTPADRQAILPRGFERCEMLRFLRECTISLAPTGNRGQLLQDFTRANW